MEIIFATNNNHKLEEIKLALPTYKVYGLRESGIIEDIPETGATLEENAKIKARFINKKYGKNCFADDTGLEVEALNGAPGVYSARYAGPQCDFKDNNEKLLAELSEVNNRKARFRTVICLILDGKEVLFEGVCSGEVLVSYQGKEGFGYDPLFRPHGHSKSFAEMSMEAKNEISHRGLAVQKLIAFLKSPLKNL